MGRKKIRHKINKKKQEELRREQEELRKFSLWMYIISVVMIAVLSLAAFIVIYKLDKSIVGIICVAVAQVVTIVVLFYAWFHEKKLYDIYKKIKHSRDNKVSN